MTEQRLLRRPLIKKFATERKFYVYDVATNLVLEVTPIEYEIVDLFLDQSLEQVLLLLAGRYNGLEIEEAYSKIRTLREHGFFIPSPLKSRLRSPEVFRECILQHFKKIFQLALEVTEHCNLRCKYCPYTEGAGFRRKHGAKHMSFEIASKAIDYFASFTDHSSEPCITFYGGEPLLAFDLIRQCAAYARHVMKTSHLMFNLTTNGVLLKEDILDFMVENDFSVLISLDGYSEAHDSNRVFPSGRGSFDSVFENVQKIHQKYPDFYRSKVAFNCVLTPLIDYEELLKFVTAKDELFGPSKVNFVPVKEEDGSIYSQGIPHARIERFRESYAALCSAYIKALSGREECDFGALRSLLDKEFVDIHKRPAARISQDCHLQPACIPGERKLFVSVDGTFHMCEKINNSLPIGNAYSGIDFERVCAIYSMYYEALNREECLQCWAIRFCKHCYATLAGDGIINEPLPSWCISFREQLAAQLRLYCTILEQNPDAFKSLDLMTLSNPEHVKSYLIAYDQAPAG